MEHIITGALAGSISRTCTAPLDLFKIQRQNAFLPHTTLRDTVRNEGVRGLWKGNGANCTRLVPHYALHYYVYKRALKHWSSSTSAAFAATTATLITYPLDNARTRLALQTQHSKYTGMVHILRRVPPHQLYQGLGMTLIGYVPFSALKFAFYGMYAQHTDSSFVAGGLAGVSAVTITYPTDLVRRRLQLQGFDATVPRYTGTIDCVHRIIRSDGVLGFYRGLSACYLKLFPTIAIEMSILNFKRQSHE